MSFRGHLEDKVVEVSIAMPVAMIIKESPINLFFTKNSLDLAHLPPNLLKDYANHLDPINRTIKLRVGDHVVRFYESGSNFIYDMCEIFIVLDLLLTVLLIITNAHIIGKLFAFIIFLKKFFTIFQQ